MNRLILEWAVFGRAHVEASLFRMTPYDAPHMLARFVAGWACERPSSVLWFWPLLTVPRSLITVHGLMVYCGRWSAWIVCKRGAFGLDYWKNNGGGDSLDYAPHYPGMICTWLEIYCLNVFYELKFGQSTPCVMCAVGYNSVRDTIMFVGSCRLVLLGVLAVTRIVVPWSDNSS